MRAVNSTRGSAGNHDTAKVESVVEDVSACLPSPALGSPYTLKMPVSSELTSSCLSSADHA